MEEQITALPRGPGMRRRWLLAVPMMVISMFAPWLGQLVLATWSAMSFNEILPNLDDEPDPTFWQEFGDTLGYAWYATWVPVLVLGWFLLRRGTIAPWPTACLVVAAFALLPGTLMAMPGNDGNKLPNIAFAIALAWLSWELGRQTVKVLSRPIARDLAESGLEIPYRLPGRPQRLRIQRNKVVLDRLRGNKQDLKKSTIMLGQAKEARLVEVESQEIWRPNKGDPIVVEPGPAN